MKIKFYVIILTIAAFTALSCKKKINPALNKPLMAAVQAGDFAQVKKLVGDGADVNANTGGLLPLVEAINKKYTDIAKFLVDEEANVNLQDKDGDTAIIVAALRGNMEILPLLKKQGADFNMRNKQGKTALMYGVYGKHSEIVRYLLKNGANPILRDKSGLDAFMLAITIKKRDIIEPLLEYGAPFTMEHLRLAHRLYCVPDNNPILKGFKNIFPKVSAPFEKVYLIKKNVEYKPYYKLIKTYFSADKTRKMEAYDNGVIKIYEANTNRFIKAFGNILFIKNVKFPFQNKLFIDTAGTLELTNIHQIESNVTEPFDRLYSNKMTVILDVNKGHSQHFNPSLGMWAMKVVRLSKSYKYYIVVGRSAITPGGNITLYESETGKKLYVFDSFDNKYQIGRFWGFDMPDISDFSDDEKLFWVKFTYNFFNSNGLVVIDISNKKSYIVLGINHFTNKMQLDEKRKFLLVDYGRGKIVRFPLS